MDLSDWDSLSPETQQKVRAAVDRMQSSHGHKRVRDSDEVSFASPKSNILLQPDTYIGHGHQRVHDSFAPPAQIKKSPILLDSDSFAFPQASEFATFTTPRRQKTRHNAFSAPASEGRGRERERPLTSTERVKLHRLRNAKYASAKSKRDYLLNKKKTTILSDAEEQKLARCQAVCIEWKKRPHPIGIQGSTSEKRGVVAALEELQRRQDTQDQRNIAASADLQSRELGSDGAILASQVLSVSKDVHANARGMAETCLAKVLSYGQASDMQNKGTLHGVATMVSPNDQKIFLCSSFFNIPLNCCSVLFLGRHICPRFRTSYLGHHGRSQASGGRLGLGRSQARGGRLGRWSEAPCGPCRRANGVPYKGEQLLTRTSGHLGKPSGIPSVIPPKPVGRLPKGTGKIFCPKRLSRKPSHNSSSGEERHVGSD